MTMTEPSGADRVATGTAPEALARITDPGVAAAIWERARDPAFAAWIDGLAPDRLPRLRTEVAPAHATNAVHAACAQAGTPGGALRDRLAEDAGALALIFAGVMGAPMLRLRLDVVEDDACRRFHCDRVRARLLCTYRGAGTEYGAGTGARPDDVHALEPGAAAVFRGALWPGEKTRLLHRSPPMARGGMARLLLVLDPRADAP